jgi:excisionase family DNA binding protein
MQPAILDRDPIAATELDRRTLAELEQLLEQLDDGRQKTRPRLLGPAGEEMALPEPVFHLLRQLVHYLARGDSVALVARQKELTTQQAADLLNVSRPYLVRLLEQGDIPFTRTGKHRRIRFGDLMAYKEQRDARRRQALSRLTRLSQEAGLYSTPHPSAE